MEMNSRFVPNIFIKPQAINIKFKLSTISNIKKDFNFILGTNHIPIAHASALKKSPKNWYPKSFSEKRKSLENKIDITEYLNTNKLIISGTIKKIIYFTFIFSSLIISEFVFNLEIVGKEYVDRDKKINPK